MTVNIIDSFKESKQAINTAQDVAKYIVGLEVAPQMNGKAVYGMFSESQSSVRNSAKDATHSGGWQRLGNHGRPRSYNASVARRRASEKNQRAP